MVDVGGGELPVLAIISNVGGGELVVIAVIALIVLGPQRLPDAARQVGRAMGELRRLSSGFQSELRSALEEAEVSPGPPRDVLGAGGPAPVEEGSVVAAEQAVAGAAPPATDGSATPPRPRRRTPLRADPAPEPGPARRRGP